jgi:hypothetical protein
MDRWTAALTAENGVVEIIGDGSVNNDLWAQLGAGDLDEIQVQRGGAHLRISVVGGGDLDAQINAAWDRLHAEQATMYDLTLRRIAATVLAKYPTAATLRLVIRHPDETRMPDSWAVDEDGLRDADGQVVVESDPAEVDDAIGEDLLTLGEMDEVYGAAVIDLRADPPELTVPDDASPGA